MEELPVGYYLCHFKTLLGFVDEQYRDILTEAERAYSERFLALPDDPARLYVRLISREGPHFRVDKLAYAEIGDLDRAAQLLCDVGLMSRNAVEDPETLLNLLKRPELDAFASVLGCSGSSRGCTKPECIVWILTQVESSRLVSAFYDLYSLVTPLGSEILVIYKLLFFGNTRQDLTEFVLSDMGLLRYEPYPLDAAQRLFNTRGVLNTTLAYAVFGEQAWLLEQANDAASLEALCQLLPDTLGVASLERRRDRILNKTGRALERADKVAEALTYYIQAKEPPSRERQTRILAKQGALKQALALCAQIEQEPLDEEELVFAQKFGPTLAKKLGRPVTPIKRPRDEETEQLTLPLVPGRRVEEAVLIHYAERGIDGFYAENHLWMNLFGLLFWDILFMPVRGAFFNRYQRGPMDLFSPHFRKERKAAIEKRLAELREGTTTLALAEAIASSRQGTTNYLVSWEAFDWPLISRVLQTIPPEQLAAMFERLSLDLGRYGSGLPDLFLFDGPSGFRLLEVKGPRDQLQANQTRWLRYFEQVGIPCGVVRVAYNGS